MASPAVSSPSPAASTVASTPCSAMCSPSTTPPTAAPPTATAAAPVAATFAPVLQPPDFPSACTAASVGTGTSIACPTLALAGTLTEMKAPFTPGCGTCMVLPGDPRGTLITVVLLAPRPLLALSNYWADG